MTSLTLDAGALIAYERRGRRLELILDDAVAGGGQISIPAGVLAQVFRDGSRQARLGTLLDLEATNVVPLDEQSARIIGVMCAVTGATDVVDASVVLCARMRRQLVVTSDRDDLLRFDPGLRVVEV